MLQRLKACLDKQTDTDFEWIIIDDGSTDHTEEYVNEWMQCAGYPIRYDRQENSGKHVAFNRAVNMAKGDIFVCVDSDDQLIPEAIEWIKSDFSKLSLRDIGVISPRISGKGIREANWSKIDSKEIDIIDLKEIYGITESAIAIRMSVLKNNEPFIKFENEKFLPESWLYLELCRSGKFLASDRGYYIPEYQETGLTKNLWSHWKNNPRGVIATLRKKYDVSKKYDFFKREIVRTKIILNINSLCLAARINIFKITPSKIKSTVLFIPAWFVYRIRYHKI